MFRALISPSSGVSQAVFLYTTIWFMWCLCCSSACCLWTGPQAHAEPVVQENHHDTSTVKPPRRTSAQAHADEQHKHHMNQMVAYKKQLEIPLMMGLREPETCRVKIKEINTQNKQLHPLVNLLQYTSLRFSLSTPMLTSFGTYFTSFLGPG